MWNVNTNGLARAAAGTTLGVWLLCTTTTTAHAQPVQYMDKGESTTRRVVPVWTGYHLKAHPGWSLGIESYAGLGVLSATEGSRGHALAGGLSRLRIGYLEAGAGLQVSDLAVVRWRQAGGFIGAFLPLVNWVDIDATIGLAQRTYLNADDRYGPGGLDLKTPAITFRLGFSDRVIDEQFGLRLGAALLFDADLKRKEAPWSYVVPGQETVTGTTHVGGFSTALVVTLGFDVAFRR
jgi:hypothetical protein